MGPTCGTSTVPYMFCIGKADDEEEPVDTLLHWAASQGLKQFALTLLQQGNTELHNHRIVMVRIDLFRTHNVDEI